MSNHRRRVVRIVLVAMIVHLGATMFVGRAYAASGVFADSFPSVAYSGSTGSVPWSDSWVEIGENNGPGSGLLQVVSSPSCPQSTCLRLGGSSANGEAIRRTADLTGSVAATLTFSYQRTHELLSLGSPGRVQLHVAPDPLGPWTLLGIYPLGGTDGSPRNESVSITGVISALTTLRFTILEGGGGLFAATDTMHIDNVTIDAAPPATTTTTSAPTTTTTGAPTTTTAATTTTTVGATTTIVGSTASTTSTTATTDPTTTTSTTTAVEPVSRTVITFASAAPPDGSDGSTPPPGHQAPIGGLGSLFSVDTETIRTGMIDALILGVVVAWAGLRLVDPEDDRELSAPGANPGQ